MPGHPLIFPLSLTRNTVYSPPLIHGQVSEPPSSPSSVQSTRRHQRLENWLASVTPGASPNSPLALGNSQPRQIGVMTPRWPSTLLSLEAQLDPSSWPSSGHQQSMTSTSTGPSRSETNWTPSQRNAPEAPEVQDQVLGTTSQDSSVLRELATKELEEDALLIKVIRDLICQRKHLKTIERTTSALSAIRSVIVGMTLTFIQNPTQELEDQVLQGLRDYLAKRVTLRTSKMEGDLTLESFRERIRRNHNPADLGISGTSTMGTSSP